MRPPPTGSAVYGRSSSPPEQLGEFLVGGGAGFLQNVVHMGLHSARGQLQRTSDVLVVLALQHLFQDDALARGQVIVLAEGGEHHDLARCDERQSRDEALGAPALVHEVARDEPHGFEGAQGDLGRIRLHHALRSRQKMHWLSISIRLGVRIIWD